MPLFKSAQLHDVLDAHDAHQQIEDLGDEDEVILFEAPAGMEHGHEGHEPLDDDAIELHGEPPMVRFELAELPGCDRHDALEVSTDDPMEVSESSDKKDRSDTQDLEVRDAWDVNDLQTEAIVPWLQERFSALPRHNGESLGIERTIAYLNRFDKKLSEIISADLDNKTDVAQMEQARQTIHDGIDRLEDALTAKRTSRSKGRKKKAESDAELIKTAQKATAVGGIIVTVPIFISMIAKTCINSTISAGKDMERTAHELIKRWDMTDREQAELIELMSNMGFPIRRPRGYKLDEKIDTTSTDLHDWTATYPA